MRFQTKKHPVPIKETGCWVKISDKVNYQSPPPPPL